ncbi:hypothetical protein [Planomicrobium sp. CPCC 101079]|uniref:hypothetical protein n=1 Tax=Planomicrobium sp. CPCC 101079 TaxID=2599618 RepID=UPI0011B6C971|nr:hypothetical protein [Planomicrobium sp. CPCC 101079]TWT03578.1 hypothetical protein FQV28_11195 [Planomicrobium sp. CPCC 101079]
MEKHVVCKLLASFLLFLSVSLPIGLSPLAAGEAQQTEEEPMFVVVGPGGPSTPGKQEADPSFSGKTAVVVAGVADDNGNLAIHFSEVTVAKLLVSKKPLEIDMSPADLTFSADNVREIVAAAGDAFTLQLGYDYANKVGNRTAVTDQISIGVKNVGGNNKSVNFSPAAKLAFNVSSSAKNLKGAKKAANGQWKNTAGKKSGKTFTISMKDLGSYTVVSN